MFKVQFDDGEIRSVKSHILRIEKASALLPLGEIPPQPSNTSASEEPRPQDEEDPDDAEEEDERGDPMQDGVPLNEADDVSENEEQGGPSGLYVGENLPPNYHQRLAEARAKIAGMLGKTVVKETFEWTVVAEHHSTELPQNRFLGIQGLELHRLDKKSIFAAMFLHLMFQDWKESLHKMNVKISANNNNNLDESGKTNNKVSLFKDHEFITGLALMIGATLYSDQGSGLWDAGSKKGEGVGFDSILPPAQFDRWMKLYRFKQFRQFITAIWEDESTKDSDPWWRFEAGVKEFNCLRQERVTTDIWSIIDEIMSAWLPRKTALGGLPNISEIKRKPEPLGKF
mmetsp:Transcript_10823/g.15631  ORF Transcript_10823/g.15631 Transcript_10823/m.15631 type:complete len:342 (+) Transcript_10823:234-1259(+)